MSSAQIVAVCVLWLSYFKVQTKNMFFITERSTEQDWFRYKSMKKKKIKYKKLGSISAEE